MKSFYNLTTRIKEELEKDEFVNTVTFGNLFDVDLDKQTIFPLSHMILNTGTYGGNIWTFNMSILCMDIVDVSKSDTIDNFLGNDNLHDVLNTQLAVINRVLDMLNRGDLRGEKYQLNGDPSVEPFKDRFKNLVAGWVLSFSVDIINDGTIC